MIDAGATKPEAGPVADASLPVTPQTCYHGSERFSLSSFSDLRSMRSGILREIFDGPFPDRLKPEDLLFLDTETTGLSGGAGTLAFEVGVGYVSGGQFVVEQFLMRDYPEEPSLLDSVAQLLRTFPVLVTFNGKTFDAPILENRLILNRSEVRPTRGPHADVLHAARRVWKLRLGRCTLQRLEQAVLGVGREDDLPGDQVPQTFFRYLQNRDFGPMERILMHNRQDVVSLAQLFFFLCKLHDKPEETDAHPADLLSLAKSASRRGENDKARKCYRLAAHGEQRAQAFAALAAQEKREGRVGRSAKLYAAMLTRGDDPVFACEALAKLYEHQLGNAEQALVYARQGLLLLSEPRLNESEAVQSSRNALQYRYARLRRKVAGDMKA